jgi:hypothetical protein
MTKNNELKFKMYIHRRRVDRNFGKVIEDKYFEYADMPEITEGKFVDMLLYAFVGNYDMYVKKMLNDLVAC